MSNWVRSYEEQLLLQEIPRGLILVICEMFRYRVRTKRFTVTVTSPNIQIHSYIKGVLKLNSEYKV